MGNDGHCGVVALQAVDKLLAEQPQQVGDDFSTAERNIAVYRDALAARWRTTRSESDRQRLAQVNAVLSVVVGGHFPLAGVPWPQLRAARECLARLVG